MLKASLQPLNAVMELERVVRKACDWYVPTKSLNYSICGPPLEPDALKHDLLARDLQAVAISVAELRRVQYTKKPFAVCCTTEVLASF